MRLYLIILKLSCKDRLGFFKIVFNLLTDISNNNLYVDDFVFPCRARAAAPLKMASQWAAATPVWAGCPCRRSTTVTRMATETGCPMRASSNRRGERRRTASPETPPAAGQRTAPRVRVGARPRRTDYSPVRRSRTQTKTRTTA